LNSSLEQLANVDTWFINGNFGLAPEYFIYFTKYKKVIERLAMDDAQSIRKVLDIIEDGTVVNDLTFISTHLAFLVIVIKKLETQNMTT